MRRSIPLLCSVTGLAAAPSRCREEEEEGAGGAGGRVRPGNGGEAEGVLLSACKGLILPPETLRQAPLPAPPRISLPRVIPFPRPGLSRPGSDSPVSFTVPLHAPLSQLSLAFATASLQAGCDQSVFPHTGLVLPPPSLPKEKPSPALVQGTALQRDWGRSPAPSSVLQHLLGVCEPPAPGVPPLLCPTVLLLGAEQGCRHHREGQKARTEDTAGALVPPALGSCWLPHVSSSQRAALWSRLSSPPWCLPVKALCCH